MLPDNERVTEEIKEEIKNIYIPLKNKKIKKYIYI